MQSLLSMNGGCYHMGSGQSKIGLFWQKAGIQGMLPALADMEKAASMPLNQEADSRQPGSKSNLMRFRPPPLQQPGGSFTGRGAQGRGVMSPLGKSTEGIVSPFAGAQVQSLILKVEMSAVFCTVFRS